MSILLFNFATDEHLSVRSGKRVLKFVIPSHCPYVFYARLPMVKEKRINLRVIPGKAESWSDREGFAWLRFDEGAEIDEKDMNAIIEMATETFAGEQFLVIADIRGLSSITDSARTFAAAKNHESVYAALAIVVESAATRIIANFFVQFHKPPRPTRIFNDTGKALAWLREFVK